MPPLPLVIPWCEQSRTLSEGSGGTGIRLYRSRWLMLAILSLLAMLSDWICFSVAPIPGLTMLAYSGVHPASLVTLFLSTNVFFCLFEPLIVKRHGLRETVVYGAALMAIGCVLRSGLPGFPTTSASVVMLGTVFVGAAQPFFQCTPALLAATWFGPDERTLATTIAINANQIGIALSYICGAYLVHDVGDFYGYFLLLAVFACSLFAFTLCFFRDAPPTPPSIASGGRASSSTALDQMGAGGSKEASASLGDALDKLGGGGGGGGGGGFIGVLKRCALLLLGAVGGGRGGGYRTTNNTWRDAADVAVQIRKLINTDGFVIASSAFVVSIGITNVISTFLDHMLEHLGFHQHTIGIIGAAFQVAIMVGSLLFGSYVDRTKKYVTATVFCFIASFFFLSGASEKELHGNGLVVCILCVGFFVGPIQPITAEIAVEVTYPADENAIVAVQQVFGNLFSALLVPLSNRVKHLHITAFNIRTDYFLLLSICGGGGLYFCTFTAPLRRLMAETAESAQASSEKALRGPSNDTSDLLGGNSDDDEDTEVGEAGGDRSNGSFRSSGGSTVMSPRVRS